MLRTTASSLALALVLASTVGCSGNAADFESTIDSGEDALNVASLGVGYDTLSQSMLNQCLTVVRKSTTLTGQTSFDLTALGNSTTTSNQLSLDVGGKAEFGIVSGSASAKIVQDSLSSATSSTIVFHQQSIVRTDSVDWQRSRFLTAATDPTFFAKCGDEVLSDVNLGADVFVALRADFANEQGKTSFEASLGASVVDLWSAETKLANVSSTTKSHMKLTVRGFQRGGDSSRITGALGAGLAKPCTGENMQACFDAVNSVVSYAGSADFLTAARATPAALSWQREKWSAHGATLNTVGASAALVTARAKLQSVFENEIRTPIRVDYLRSYLPASLRTAADTAKATALRNQTTIVNYGVPACYPAVTVGERPLIATRIPGIGGRPSRTIFAPDMSAPTPTSEACNNAINTTLKQYGFVATSTTSLETAVAPNYSAAPLASAPLGSARRSDWTKDITVGEAPWGTWTNMEYCPAGQFAVGYRMRVEAFRGSCSGNACDDTGLNAVELLCMSPSHGAQSTLRAHDGLWGDWNPTQSCGFGPMVGASLRIEPGQGSGDDTAADDMQGVCLDSSTVVAPGGAAFGAWGGKVSCPSGSAVCGIQVKFEGSQGDNDDTALNGVRLACCTY
jgi:Vitelline membrane outer layer protein I (VOMI)